MTDTGMEEVIDELRAEIERLRQAGKIIGKKYAAERQLVEATEEEIDAGLDTEVTLHIRAEAAEARVKTFQDAVLDIASDVPNDDREPHWCENVRGHSEACHTMKTLMASCVV